MSTVQMDVRLSAGSQQVFTIAQALAREQMHAAVGAAHLLKALLHKDIGLEPRLWQMDQDVYYIADWADTRMEGYRKAAAPKITIRNDEAVLAVLEEADTVRVLQNEEEVEPMHLLIALSTPGVGFSFEQLKTFPLQRDELLQAGDAVKEPERETAGANGSTGVAAGGGGVKGNATAGVNGGGGQALLKYCRDKVLEATQGSTDPIIGRERELRRMLEILSRRSKPNVLLIGEPGVGKTALVDGFALAIGQGQTPDFLKGARLFELDKGALIAGAAYKGEVEERLKSILQEIKGFDKAILFIDELHTLLDKERVADLLKPELSRGTITLIGATTPEGYRKHIEKDEAFARRFEGLDLEEPDAEMAFRMVQTVLPRYEQHHGLAADEAALREAVRLAKRYIQDRKLPDAAIDLVDQAMATLRLAVDMGEEESRQLDIHDLHSIVAGKTGIPVGKLQSDERERLLLMPETLRQRVVGQDQAIHAICEAILESRAGLSRPGQPIGSFFFLGPTGTGKTELAKALAALLFEDERSMIRFDMSEFKEEHSAALLYGAPPGYIGYEEGGLLVNKIRQQPYAVVLFDEIEKAHPSVFDIFLQMMDEGQLHDKLGRQGDFSNALIIFTSNIASRWVTEAFARGETPTHSTLLEKMASHFRPEFLGRLTEIVPFGPMRPEMMEAIFSIQMKGLHQLLAGQGVKLTITPAAAQYIAEIGFSQEYGARPLAGVIRGQVRRPLARMIVSGELLAESNIQLELVDGRLVWNR
ncbi:ATP-dependent Clp protease ATP-binding subunit [Puia dinghuensis]|uniref:Chaperone protein ClpB n=1 Tax=Puia dinghuensis TaxID=1792502 RepID=A0A8J2UD12_9BACT|nr:ATP-dependent Clp protease ATP-binding subunit [Puia dinghuensis]GGB00748.1 chaperone protein ClpB [Puia dinghuensis]